MEEELTELLPIPDTTAVGGKQPDNRPDDRMTRQKTKKKPTNIYRLAFKSNIFVIITTKMPGPYSEQRAKSIIFHDFMIWKAQNQEAFH